jgi:hypothetical protein
MRQLIIPVRASKRTPVLPPYGDAPTKHDDPRFGLATSGFDILPAPNI